MNAERDNSQLTENQGATNQAEGARVTKDGTGTGPAGAVVVSVRPLGQRKTGGEKAIDAKVVRWIAGKYGLNQWGLQFLATLSMALLVHARPGGGLPEKVVFNWSGKLAGWKSRMNEGMKECLNMGVIDRLHIAGGTVLAISSKGEYLLEKYDEKFEEIRQGLALTAATNALRGESARLRSQIAAARKRQAAGMA